MSSVVIRVENLYKEYRLGTISHGTLHRDLQSWWARMRGKEDPNSIISHRNRPSEQGPSTDNPHILALNDVSFDVRQGDVVGIIGRNGAGKSTLLKILSEVTAPTRGTVRMKGRVASLLEVGTGFHPELTGRENIYLNGAILGMTKREITRKFDEIVNFAEIEKFIDTPVKRYSSGMYVRLAFAVAAHLEPEILIVDEVLAVGDAEFQKKCLGKMGDVAKGGRTVLFVSHNMGAIQYLCSKALFLKEGSIEGYDATEQMIMAYTDSRMKTISGFYTAQDKGHQPYFKSIRISQGGRSAGAFAIDRPIKIEFEIETFGMRDLVVGCSIRNSRGNFVHHSSDEFRSENILHDSGRECELPPYALAQGRYFLSAGLFQRNYEIFERISDALSFYVEFVGIMSDKTQSADWKGLCGPGLLKWR